MAKKRQLSNKVCQTCGESFRGYATARYCGLACQLWGSVDKSAANGCWVWTGAVRGIGYGQICRGIDGKRKHLMAHRVSYELAYGPIPFGMCVCHSCDNPSCVNPAHLWLGTGEDNRLDMMEKGRQSRPRGEANAMAKLTAGQVMEIYNDSRVNHVVAAEYGVKHQSVSKIKTGQRWAHITKHERQGK